jgi:hypothetical protein
MAFSKNETAVLQTTVVYIRSPRRTSKAGPAIAGMIAWIAAREFVALASGRDFSTGKLYH